MLRALVVLQSRVAGTHLGGINLDSQMEGNMYKRKSDAGTFRSNENLEEAPAGRSGTTVSTGNQVDVSYPPRQQVGP